MDDLRWLQDENWVYFQVSGADRTDFFNRLTTNTIPKAGDPLVHNFFLSVNARVLAEFWIGAESDQLCLLTPRAHAESAQENIGRYHFGEKIELSQPPGSLFVLVGPAEERKALCALASKVWEPDPRYGPDSCWVFVTEAELPNFLQSAQRVGQPLAAQQAELLRVSTGRPSYGLDYTSETLFLEMAQQGDYSESKGCYPGQEIVARVLHRGRLNRSLRAFQSSAMIPEGWTISKDGKEIARVTTVVPTQDGGSVGYLYLRREVGGEGTVLTGAGKDGSEVSLTVSSRAGEVLTEA